MPFFYPISSWHLRLNECLWWQDDFSFLSGGGVLGLVFSLRGWIIPWPYRGGMQKKNGIYWRKSWVLWGWARAWSGPGSRMTSGGRSYSAKVQYTMRFLRNAGLWWQKGVCLAVKLWVMCLCLNEKGKKKNSGHCQTKTLEECSDSSLCHKTMFLQGYRKRPRKSSRYTSLFECLDVFSVSNHVPGLLWSS